MGLPARPEIEKYAADRFTVFCESTADEDAKKRMQVLGAARRTGNIGAYLTALIDFEAERLRVRILAYASARVEAFNVYGAACDKRAETDLETAAARITGSVIAKIRGELRLLSGRLRIPEEGRGIPWHLKIERTKSTALKEGKRLVNRCRGNTGCAPLTDCLSLGRGRRRLPVVGKQFG